MSSPIRLNTPVLAAILTAVLLLSTTFPASAVVPQEISYQARLNDSGGNPLNGTVTITFTLYLDAGGSSASGWTETYANVAVSNGIFDVNLGSKTAFSTVPGLFSQPLFLGIKVGGDDEMAPLQALLTAPYAFRAETIDDGGIGASALATDAVETDKIQDGAVTEAKINRLNLDADSVDGVDGLNIVTKSGGGVINADLEVTGSGRIRATGAGVEFADGSLQTTAAAPSGATTFVNVSCPGDSIQAAIDSAPSGGKLEVVINGFCNENVVVTRDWTTIRGGTNPVTDGINGQAAFEGAVSASGTNGVVLNNLTLTSGVSDGYGVYADSTADITITNSMIVGNSYGIFNRWGAFVRVEDTTFQSQIFSSWTMTDGGKGFGNNITAIESLPLGPNFDETVIAMYRDTSLRLRGTNIIHNTAASTGNGDPYALSVYHSSMLRQDGGSGSISVIGLVEAGSLSNIQLRSNPTVVGNVNAYSNSFMQIRGGVGTITGNVQLGEGSLGDIRLDVTGDFDINDGSKLNTGFGATIEGEINMRRAHLNVNNNTTIRGNIQTNLGSVIEVFSGALIEGQGGGAGNIQLNSSEMILDGTFTGDLDLRRSNFDIFNQGNMTGNINLTRSEFGVAGGTFTGDINASSDSKVTIYDDGTAQGNGGPGAIFLTRSELSIQSDYTGMINTTDGSDVVIASFNGPTPVVTGDVGMNNNGSLRLDSGTIIGNVFLDSIIARVENGSSIQGDVFLADSKLDLTAGSSITGNLDYEESNVTLEQGLPSPIIAGNINFHSNSILRLDDNVTLDKTTGNIFYFGNSELQLRDNATINIGEGIFFDIHSRLQMGENTTIARANGGDEALSFGDFSTMHLNEGVNITGRINMNDAAIMKLFSNPDLPDIKVTIDGDIIVQGGPPNSISIFNPASAEFINGHGINCNSTGVVVSGKTPTFTGGGGIDANCDTSNLIP